MATQDNRNFDNRTLFWGDNIDFLRAMNSETVDLIATDPPFNKGRDFHATPDSLAAGASFQDRWKWDEEAHPQFTDALLNKAENKKEYAHVWTVIESARASWGDDMGAFLCFMGVRLMEMHRILKPTGSIYLHCDPTASHYLKTLMDAVFGRANFRNEIVWKRRADKHNLARKNMGRIHDLILYYAKTVHTKYNRQFLPYDDDYVRNFYKHEDDRGLYRTLPCTNESGGNRPYEFRGIVRSWRFRPERMEEMFRAGLLVQAKPGSPFQYKKYLKDAKGVPIQDLWDDIAPSRGKEATGYPTQKPLALYERIIRASSNPGDMVLDPFAGCATTCVAAERLERQWVGIDLWKETKDLTVARLKAEKRMFALEQMTVTDIPPARTDDGEVASPDLTLKMQRQLAKWQRLYRHEIFDYLAEAQVTPTGLITCAGCGRSHEYEYMQLDHIRAKDDGGEDYITNRVLLCGPCNRWKSNIYGLAGLRRANKRREDKRGKVWMQDEEAAKSAQDRAQRKAEEVRDNLS